MSKLINDLAALKGRTIVSCELEGHLAHATFLSVDLDNGMRIVVFGRDATVTVEPIEPVFVPTHTLDDIKGYIVPERDQLVLTRYSGLFRARYGYDHPLPDARVLRLVKRLADRTDDVLIAIQNDLSLRPGRDFWRGDSAATCRAYRALFVSRWGREAHVIDDDILRWHGIMSIHDVTERMKNWS